MKTAPDQQFSLEAECRVDKCRRDALPPEDGIYKTAPTQPRARTYEVVAWAVAKSFLTMIKAKQLRDPSRRVCVNLPRSDSSRRAA